MNAPYNKRELELEIELATLKSHEKHMSYIYGIRIGGLIIAALTIIIGSIMIFKGLEGSFNWAIEVPESIGAKLTNASPGIIFATIGLLITFVSVTRPPVTFKSDRKRDGAGASINIVGR